MIKKIANGVLAAGWYAMHPRALKTAITGSNELTLRSGSGWNTTPNYTGKAINELTMLQITTAWACIRLISETIGTLPLKVYRRNADGSRERDREHPAHELLSISPSLGMTPISFKEAMTVSLCSHGQAFLKPERMQSTGRVFTLTPIPKTAVEPITDYNRDTTGRPLGWRVTLNGRVTEYALDELISVTGWGGTGYSGFSPFLVHANALGIAAAADEYAARYFAENATPAGVLEVDTKLTPTQRIELRAAWKEMHQGATKRNEIGILELGSRFKKMQDSMKESQNIEVRQHQVGEVAKIWRVPPNLVGDLSKATFNNVEQMNRHFLQHTLAPYLKRIEEALNAGLFTPSERSTRYVEFDTGGLLMADAKTRAEVQRIEILSGTRTINEIREMNNLPPVEGGDKIIVQSNMAPLDELGDVLGTTTLQDEAA